MKKTKIVLIAFILLSFYASAQNKTKPVKKNNECHCSCPKVFSKYDELLKLKEVYTKKAISYEEYMRIKIKIVASIEEEKFIEKVEE